MICFMDMTFCNAPCAASCGLRLTDAVLADAARWWKPEQGEPPIAVADLREGCSEYLPEARP